MTQKIYQGDTGLRINVDVGQSVGSALTTNLLVKKPDGSEETWSASITGTDTISYTTDLNDLDQAGEYVIQAQVSWDPLSTHKSESFSLMVYKKYR